MKNVNVADKLMVKLDLGFPFMNLFPMRMSLKAGAWIDHNYGTVFGTEVITTDGYFVQTVNFNSSIL